MLIRSATMLDLPAIAALHSNVTAELRELAPEGFGAPLDTMPGVGDVAGVFRDMLDDSDYVLLVAEDEGQVAAFASGLREDHGDDLVESPYLTIEFVEVAPTHRGRGIAAELIAALEADARRRGLKHVDLRVWEGNDGARQLYDRLGYRTLEMRMAKVL
jgi:ribosomal protein S18 acetylase RimI-like enzyme